MKNRINCRSEKVGDDIYLVDTEYLDREKFAASYFIESNGELAIIETNTNNAVPRIISAVENEGFSLGQVKYVILTHIHLDHAGGAGLLMKKLPSAKLVVHPRGARHMTSPEKLIDSVKQVYGEEEYKRLYGNILPVHEKRLIQAEDGAVIKVGNRELLLKESPGHAKHHIVIFDEFSGSLFSGDAFGIGYPLFRYKNGMLAFPSTSPVQFDPDRAIETFKMIMNLKPEKIMLTHFGVIENIDEVNEHLTDWIDFAVNTSKDMINKDLKGDELNKALLEYTWAFFNKKIIDIRGTQLTGEEKDFLFLDADLNSKGLAFYIEQKRSLK
ncbi:MAG: MBL fold metallo-hydrolase [Acidobacteriota bacterium]